MPHPYTPVDSSRREIRLVTLLPASSPDDPVECVLSSVFLAPGTDYEALSYVWGDERKKTRIQLDDQRFMVTLNLESALSHLRLTYKPRVLWVDALCINQEDQIEKAAQVTFMTDIYDQAKIILSWLGRGSRDTADVYDFLKDDNRFDQLRQVRGLQSERRAEGYISHLRYAITEMFVDNPVWRRIWIVQELAMAKSITFCCGYQTLTMAELVLFSESLELFKYEIKDNPDVVYIGKQRIKGHTPFQRMLYDWCEHVDRSIGGLGRFNRKGKTFPDIHTAVLEYSTWLASNRHDMIYAVRGICENQFDIGVDYTQPAGDLYCKFTKSCLEHRPNPDVLLMDSLFPSRELGLTPLSAQTAPQPEAVVAPLPDLPSWACDLAATLPDGRKVHVDTHFCFYECGVKLGSGSLDAHDGHDAHELYELTDSLYELTLAGLIIDKVAIIHDGDPFAKKWSVDGLFSSTFKGSDEYFTGESLDDARWRTYLEDFDWAHAKGGRLRYDKKKRAMFRSAWKALSSGPRGMFSSVTGSQEHDAVKRAIRAALEQDKRFAETDSEFYASLPSNAEVGDVLFVPVKCRMPLLLREVAEGKYRLIGKAYVHGFMDNELRDGGGTAFESCIVVLV